MEPKEPSPTHPNRTEHKQEPPTRSRGRPRLPTEQKEQPPKRPRGRPPLTIEQKEERKQLRLANVSQEQKQEQRASQQSKVNFFAPSTLTWCLFFSIDFCARFFCVFFRIVKNGYPTQ